MNVLYTGDNMRAFIRAFWGGNESDLEKSREHLLKNDIRLPPDNSVARWNKIKENIKCCLEMPHITPFVTYVFGSNNYEYLTNLGLECRLINELPYCFREYRHKLEVFKYAMKEFDEVVFLDWDTKPTKPLPLNFWDKLNEKEVFQASLWAYRHPKITHRSNAKDNRFCPASGFVYMRDKCIPDKLIKHWENASNQWSAEPPFALLTDEMTNGWKGLDKYWKLFEPECYSCKRSPYRNDPLKYAKDVCFVNRGNAWKF